MENNVHVITVQPKTITRPYRLGCYKVEFDPTSQRWKWSIEVTHTFRGAGEAASIEDAEKAAKAKLDIYQGSVLP